MAGSQYDVARSFDPLFGGFGPLELDPRRVGGPTRHGGFPMRRDALFLPPFGLFWRLCLGTSTIKTARDNGRFALRLEASATGHGLKAY